MASDRAGALFPREQPGRDHIPWQRAAAGGPRFGNRPAACSLRG